MAETPETGVADLERKLDALPKSPGVYLFKDSRGKPIYVGKAKDLRSRVRSYFRAGDDGRLFTPFIVRRTADFEVLATGNETEALILENNLIKQHKPRYNVKLVDDKTYVSLRLDTRQTWPKIQVVRKPRRDKALYFGPYGSASSVRRTLRILQTFFRLRTCSDAELKNRTRPCLEYQIGRCTAPCVGRVTEEAYRVDVQGVVGFLSGRDDSLLRSLRERMAGAAADFDFEEASRLRDQIVDVEKTLVPQNVHRHHQGDRDVFALARDGAIAVVQALFIREGKLVSARSFDFESSLDEPELWAGFLSQFYLAHGNPPVREILLPVLPPEVEALEELLEQRSGSKVEIKVPQKGEKRELLEMGLANAGRVLKHGEEQRERRNQLLQALQVRLGLPRLPRTIECFDNAHLGGTAAVASKVRFEDGSPDKGGYRHYKIRSASGDDDFAMMEEVLRRRLSGGQRDGDLPDLVLVDGGKGQLGRAVAVAAELGIDVMLASIAKARKIPGRPAPVIPGIEAAGESGQTEERIFLPGRPDAIDLPRGSPERHLVERIRDEAHRFANDFHRELRKKRSLRSGLDEVPGVGPKRKKLLLRHFGSLRGIKGASEMEIAALPGISQKLAAEIKAFLQER